MVQVDTLPFEYCTNTSCQLSERERERERERELEKYFFKISNSSIPPPVLAKTISLISQNILPKHTSKIVPCPNLDVFNLVMGIIYEISGLAIGLIYLST